MRPGLEIVVIARRGASELSAQETMAALENLMESLEARVQ
jgi:RNase P protein component